MTVTLRGLGVKDADWFRPAFADYFAEIAPGLPVPDLSEWWTDPDCEGLVIADGASEVGFALVELFGAGRRELAEFTILPAHRRRGLGRAAAVAMLSARPGRWRFGVIDRPDALAFWPMVLAACPGVTGLERTAPVTELQAMSYRFTITEGEKG
ncbi:GNAT family N-acetyltransferase [Rhodobacterales bacterium HKCCE2091]|nr:GNAT family N-acetyltransferase [Rhodobacterales bacterium HKCCE2091]